MKIRTIGLHGSYNSRNFGDTLILKITHDWIKDNSKNNRVVFPRITNKLELFEITGSDLNPFDFSNLDGLVFGPGGYFGEPPYSFFKNFKWSRRNYKRHLKWANVLYSKKIPYMIMGVGVGPISNFFLRMAIIKLFRKASFISVRDELSKKFLIKWGIEPTRIHVFCDVALSLPISTENKPKSKRVGLHIPGNDLADLKKINEFLEFVNRYLSEYSFTLVEDLPNQFSNFNKVNELRDSLIKLVPQLDIAAYESPNQLINLLKEFDVIITTKLHVGIVSYALGRQVISIPRHTKTIRFYEQIGRSKFCLPVQDFSFEKLNELFLTCLKNEKVSNVMFKESFKNKDLLDKFLNSL